MSVAFQQGQTLGRSDLNIYLTDAGNHPINAAEIYYALYDFTTGAEVLIGDLRRIPMNPTMGEYYASITIPMNANVGDYRIRWTFREQVGSPPNSVVQEFEVTERGVTATATYGEVPTDLMRRLRILLRDNNPDRNYHFRPPEHEGTVAQYNRVFGFIWEDLELWEYIQRAMDMIIAAPPRTPFQSVESLIAYRREWTTLLLMGAMMHALQALRINWISEEFSYSIGGISLDLEKSSKYEGAFQGAADQFDKQLEKAKLTVKIVKGLQQPKFGIGIRSSFGPFMGRGVLSPRKFVGM